MGHLQLPADQCRRHSSTVHEYHLHDLYHHLHRDGGHLDCAARATGKGAAAKEGLGGSHRYQPG